MNAYDVIPDERAYDSLRSDFIVLVSRIIVDYVPFFSTDYKGIPQSHIPHQFTKEMSCKSEAVSMLTKVACRELLTCDICVLAVLPHNVLCMVAVV